MSELIVGIGISTSSADGLDPLVEAGAAESLGYDFVSASDHPVGAHPTYETIALLTWIAAHTDRIGIATRVLGVPFRSPAMIAKTAESLQRLSGGRLILGLGAGYSDDEIAALGGALRTPRQKVDGLRDAIEIMRKAWAGSAVSHDGTQYTVRNLSITPAPIAPIPIWLGTYGPRALAVTGRLADGWIPSLGSAGPDKIPDMLDRIRTAATDAGRSPEAVRPVYNVPVRLDPTGRSDSETLSGSAADIADQLAAFIELGFRGFNLMPAYGQARAVAEEVLPILRNNT